MMSAIFWLMSSLVHFQSSLIVERGRREGTNVCLFGH